MKKNSNNQVPFKPLPPIPGQNGKQFKPNKQNLKNQGPMVSRRGAPVAIGVRKRMSVPIIRREGNKTIVTHREYIGEILGSTSLFAVANTIPINPGLPGSFPWLFAIANQYESYKFRKLDFCFETEKSTATSGYVALCVDYDPEDPAPVSKTQAFSYDETVRAAPWDSFCHSSKLKNLTKRSSYFTRPGALTAGDDLGLYDIGNLFVIVGGEADATTLGELWAEYIIEFETPQISGVTLSELIVAGGVESGANPLGTVPVVTGALSTSLSAASVLTFNQYFEGLIAWYVGGTTITALSITASSGSTSTEIAEVINGTALLGMAFNIVKMLPGSTLTFAATAATVTSSQARIGAYQFSLG